MKKIFTITCLLIFVVVIQSCTKKGSLKVNVATINPDLTTTKLVNLTAELMYGSGVTVSTKQTDNNGDAIFPDLKAGTYIIHVTNNDNRVQRYEQPVTFQLKSGEQKEINISDL